MAEMQEMRDHDDFDAPVLGGEMAKTAEETQLMISQNGGIEASTPMQMLAVAVSRGAGIDELGKLMDLQERWEKNEARKAFVSAMTAFKEHPPTIRKNKHVRFETSKGVVEYDHATLDHVCDAITQELGKHGVTHRWDLEQTGDVIKVTCILTHEMGHSEKTSLQGSPDTSGVKNSNQSISSTVTYLQRYTLLAACGLAAENTDDDGRGGGMTNGELDEQLGELARCETLAGLDAAFKAAAAKALEAKDINAYTALKEAKDKRKKELAR